MVIVEAPAEVAAVIDDAAKKTHWLARALQKQQLLHRAKLNF
jgi:hypothetical protein